MQKFEVIDYSVWFESFQLVRTALRENPEVASIIQEVYQ